MAKKRPDKDELPLPKGCDFCDDQGPLVLSSVCHMTAPLQAELEDGVLTLRCYVPDCSRVVARLRVSAILKE